MFSAVTSCTAAEDSAWAGLQNGHLASAEWRRKALSPVTWHGFEGPELILVM